MKKLTENKQLYEAIGELLSARDRVVEIIEDIRDDEANQDWDTDTCYYVEDILNNLDNLDIDQFSFELTRDEPEEKEEDEDEEEDEEDA